MQSDLPRISVVAPAYRCADCLDELHRRLTTVLDDAGTSFELILVNDGSPQADWQVIERLAAADHRVKGVNLSRNFGQHSAIAAGIDQARGEWVVVMDADLQDRPEEIPRLLEMATSGYDIVFAQRLVRRDGFMKRFWSKTFTAFFNVLSSIRIVEGLSNFSIFSRQVANAFRSLRERTRSYGLLMLWLGFRVGYLEVRHSERFAGTSSYTFLRALRHALDSIVSQSDQPLRLSIKLGFLTSIAAAVYAAWLAIRYYWHGVAVQGWTSVMVSMFFLAGVILADLGVVGLYLGKVFDEAKGRPLYVVRDTINIGSN